MDSNPSRRSISGQQNRQFTRLQSWRVAGPFDGPPRHLLFRPHWNATPLGIPAPPPWPWLLSMDVIDSEEAESQTSLFSILYVICDDSFTDSLLRLMMASNWLCCFVNLAYMARHKLELLPPSHCLVIKKLIIASWDMGHGAISITDTTKESPLLIASDVRRKW